MGADARTFTQANASGHYRLDLSKPPEREVRDGWCIMRVWEVVAFGVLLQAAEAFVLVQVAMRLIEIRNGEREWAASLPKPKGLLPVCADEVAEKHMRCAHSFDDCV